MNSRALIQPLTSALTAQSECRAVFLSGSHARGTDDAYSDLDLLAVVDPAAQAGFVEAWRGILTADAPLILFRSTLGPG